MTPEEAADLFQEVWLDLYTGLSTLRKPSALGGWLISVASHKCFQWKRKRQRVAEQQNGALDPDPPDTDILFPEWKEQAERQQMLRETVLLLPERCQHMVRLLFFQDPPIPYADLARQLGLAEGSIGFIRRRCLDRLRALLEQKGF
jgi:RNA polymerase sigma factor (sigma-70 family)